MELVAQFAGLVVVFMIGFIAVVLSRKYSRRSVGEFPGMGTLKIPCDPALHTDFLNALKQEKIQFMPPTESKPLNTSPGATQDPPLCVVQVAEKDYQRAKQLLAEFQGKWFA